MVASQSERWVLREESTVIELAMSGNEPVHRKYSTLTELELVKLVKPTRESRREPNCRGGAPFPRAPEEAAELKRHGLVRLRHIQHGPMFCPKTRYINSIL